MSDADAQSAEMALQEISRKKPVIKNRIAEENRKRCSDRTFHFVGEAARVMALSRSSWSYAYEQAVSRTRRQLSTD